MTAWKARGFDLRGYLGGKEDSPKPAMTVAEVEKIARRVVEESRQKSDRERAA